ncbi:hypothetical protein FACS1894180_1610 [Bacteroidia bacterium]|nr:hypothetical protein FACS1894180_1610 [Bacteroidia bacterium]
MKNFVKIISFITFAAVSLTVASIFYEGITLRWLGFVGILIPATDVLFLVATIAGIIYYKNAKMLFYSHLFSVIVIVAGIIITLIYGHEIPKLLFTAWEFYIFYFYGYIVVKKLWNTVN